MFALFVCSIGKACRCRFVDYAQNFKSRYCSSILCSLALSVCEVCRACDYGFCHGRTQIFLCIPLEFLKDHGRYLLGRVLLVVNLDFEVAAHLSLNRDYGTIGVYYCLTLCKLPHKSFIVFCKSYYGRCGSCSFRVRDNGDVVPFFYRYTAIGCTKVDSYYFFHMRSHLSLYMCFIVSLFTVCAKFFILDCTPDLHSDVFAYLPTRTCGAFITRPASL